MTIFLIFFIFLTFQEIFSKLIWYISNNTNNITNYNNNIFKNINNKSLFNNYLNKYFLCQVGYVKGGSFVNNNRQILDLCISRSFNDRIGLQKTWKDEINQKDILNSPINLFKSLTKSHSLTNLIFLGDSVSSQLFNFLYCDLIQSTHLQSNLIQWVDKPCQFCLSYVDFWELSSTSKIEKTKILRIYNRQFNLPCLHDSNNECDNGKQSELLCFQFIQKLLDNITRITLNLGNSKSSQTIFIINYGLHILSKDLASWSLNGMLKGMIHFIHHQNYYNNNNMIFFYRETSSQVFSLSKDGSYLSSFQSSNNPSQSVSNTKEKSFCCDYPKEISSQSNWRNDLTIQYLTQIDSNWRKYLQWIPFYNISLELYDLRAESHKINQVDCTHFIYTSNAYYALWFEIQEKYEEMLKIK